MKGLAIFGVVTAVLVLAQRIKELYDIDHMFEDDVTA